MPLVIDLLVYKLLTNFYCLHQLALALQLMVSTVPEMVIYVPMRIEPYEQVEKLVTMEEDSSVVVNLM